MTCSLYINILPLLVVVIAAVIFWGWSAYAIFNSLIQEYSGNWIVLLMSAIVVSPAIYYLILVNFDETFLILATSFILPLSLIVLPGIIAMSLPRMNEREPIAVILRNFCLYLTFVSGFVLVLLPNFS